MEEGRRSAFNEGKSGRHTVDGAEGKGDWPLSEVSLIPFPCAKPA